MKKYLALGLIVSLLFPYLSFAYELSDKDKSIVISATAKVEKMIQARGESMRNRVIALLEKAVSKYPNNPRLRALVGKTIENLRPSNDMDLGDLFEDKDTQATATGTVVQVEEKKPVVQSPIIPRATTSTGVTYIPPVEVPPLSIVKIGEIFKVENVEYEILNVEVVDYFYSNGCSYHLINNSWEPFECTGKTQNWKPKNSKFILVKFRAKNLAFDETNANRESVFLPLSIGGYMNGKLKYFDEDVSSAVNVSSMDSSHQELMDYSWSSNISVPGKYFRVFDVEAIDYDKSYLKIGNKNKVALSILR